MSATGPSWRANYVSGRIYPRNVVTDELFRVTSEQFRSVRGFEEFAMSHYEKHDNGMEAIAEACCTPEEVKAILLPKLEAAFLEAKRAHMPVREARGNIYRAAYKFLGTHYYVLPQQKKTIERWSKRLLKGYQKWWKRVEAEAKRIERKYEKNGSYGDPTTDAIRLVSPELYPMVVTGELGEA